MAPQPSPLVQRLDELGGHLDVVAEDQLVLRDAVDVPHAPHQVTVHARRQLAVPQLRGRRGDRGCENTNGGENAETKVFKPTSTSLLILYFYNYCLVILARIQIGLQEAIQMQIPVMKEQVGVMDLAPGCQEVGCGQWASNPLHFS